MHQVRWQGVLSMDTFMEGSTGDNEEGRYRSSTYQVFKQGCLSSTMSGNAFLRYLPLMNNVFQQGCFPKKAIIVVSGLPSWTNALGDFNRIFFCINERLNLQRGEMWDDVCKSKGNQVCHRRYDFPQWRGFRCDIKDACRRNFSSKHDVCCPICGSTFIATCRVCARLPRSIIGALAMQETIRLRSYFTEYSTGMLIIGDVHRGSSWITQDDYSGNLFCRYETCRH